MLKQKKKIKILITDAAPLYPPLWGGPKRIWNLYSNLFQNLFDIAYIGVNFDIKGSLRYRFNKIRNNFIEILCALPKHYYLWHFIEKTISNNGSLNLFVYLWIHTDWQFKYILNSQNADIIVCSHPWSSLCVRKDSRQFFIYDAHNCEYLLMDQILGKHLLKGLVLQQVKKIELDACRKSDLILVCSEKEKKDFIDLYNIDTNKIIVIPNGANISENDGKKAKLDYRLSLSLSSEEKVVIFIGTYYKPNIDAARFIIKKIAPILKEFRFLIVGTVSDAFKTEQISSNIKLLGRVSEEQLDIVLRASDIAINPMFDGSGINIKMLDYMSYGLPIVTTECGARGIETFGRQPMIISSIDKFIDNIKILSSDVVLYQRMSEAGRNLVAERYDWKQISAKLQDIIIERLPK